MIESLLDLNADMLERLDMSHYDDGSDPSAAWVMLDGRSLHALRTLTMGEGGPYDGPIDETAFGLDAPNLVRLTATPWIVALLSRCPLAAQIRSLAIVYQYGADAPDLEAFQALENLSYGDAELDRIYLSALPASLKKLQVDFDNTADGLIEWLSTTYRYERRQMRTIQTTLMDGPEEESLAQLEQLRGLCDELGIGLVEK